MDARRLIAERGDWEAMRRAFRWRLPARFNIARACCDDWAAAEPGRTAIVEAGGRIWTHGALKTASDRLANAFRGRGVGRGDRIAVLLPQAPEVMVAHLAAWKLGAVTLPLFTLFGPDALRFRLADSGARVVVTDRENLDKVMSLRADLPDLAEVVVTGAAAAGARRWDDELAAASEALEPVDTAADDPAAMIYTSGTTGQPKGVLHAHRFLLGHLPAVELFLEGFPQPGDVGWTPADWAWIGGLMDLAMPCLWAGVPLVSHRMRKFDPDAAFRLIAEHRVSVAFLPPTALKLMRGAPVPDRARLRAVGSGGESLGADLLDWGGETLRAPINELYGQTECNLVVCSDSGSRRAGAMGKPVPGHEVAVLGAGGAAVPDGAIGEIAVRAPDPAMFLGYWNQPEMTAAKVSEGWLRTGDLGRRDADGFLTYVSRDDDVITSAGYRIGPSEIEHCLAGHPDVVMAAVVGEPDPVRTEIVVAHVVLRGGASREGLADALTQRVRERISPHVAPRRIVWAESLPLTATGKIMRRELRDRGKSPPGA